MVPPSYIDAQQWAFLILQNLPQGPEIAQYLLLELTNWMPSQLQFHQKDVVPSELWRRYQAVIRRAQTGEPPQYILGQAWFYGRQFQVNTNTLIPRQDSEMMIAQILQEHPHGRLLELGTGSGALVETLALEGQYQAVTATDISSAALQVARANAERYQLAIDFRQGDLFAPVARQLFDVIVFNPPYIGEEERKYMDQSVLEFEPQQALFATEEGLSYYRRIFAQFSQFLAPKGQLYLEFGFQQQEKLSKMFQEQVTGFQIQFFRDLSNQPRFLRIQRKEVN